MNKEKSTTKAAHSHCLSTREVLIIIRRLTCIPFWSGGILLSLKSSGGGNKEDLIHAPPSAINSMLKEIYKQLSSVGYSTVPDTGTYTVGHES